MRTPSDQRYPRAFKAEALLEPLNLVPAGTVLTPIDTRPIIVHVDAVRHQRNRHFNLSPPEPLVRIIIGEVIYHARAVALGPSTLAEAYGEPLPRRTQAICVLKTSAPVTVLE